MFLGFFILEKKKKKKKKKKNDGKFEEKIQRIKDVNILVWVFFYPKGRM